MKILRRSIVSLLASVTLALAGAGSTQAASVNGSFEDGSFTGWTTAGSTGIASAAFGVTPSSGNFQALATNASGSLATSSVESFLDLSAGTLNALSATTPGANQPFEGSAFQQTLTVNAGDVISFSYSFLTDETTPDPSFNDFAFYSFNGAAFLLADTNAVFQPSASPFTQETGYRTVSFTVTAAGTYSLGFGVLDNSDPGGDSGLLIDNVQAVSIPEPSPLIGLIGLSLTGGVIVIRRRNAARAD